MGWIEKIIREEKRKHHDMQWGEKKYNHNWARVAEDRIIKQLEEDGVLKKELCPEE